MKAERGTVMAKRALKRNSSKSPVCESSSSQLYRRKTDHKDEENIVASYVLTHSFGKVKMLSPQPFSSNS